MVMEERTQLLLPVEIAPDDCFALYQIVVALSLDRIMIIVSGELQAVGCDKE